MSDRPKDAPDALRLLEWHAAADDNHDAMDILRWVRALMAERDALRARCERPEKALRFLSTYEKEPPEIAKDEFAYNRLLAYIHATARAALSEVKP